MTANAKLVGGLNCMGSTTGNYTGRKVDIAVAGTAGKFAWLGLPVIAINAVMALGAVSGVHGETRLIDDITMDVVDKDNKLAARLRGAPL